MYLIWKIVIYEYNSQNELFQINRSIVEAVKQESKIGEREKTLDRYFDMIPN